MCVLQIFIIIIIIITQTRCSWQMEQYVYIFNQKASLNFHNDSLTPWVRLTAIAAA